MTQRRALEARLALYADLSGILNAMRSYALVELRRVTRREAAQHEATAALAQAHADMAAAFPATATAPGDIWILLGSVRGFCASFNEDVLNRWRQAGNAALATIVAGERLAALMPGDFAGTSVPGAISSADAMAAIERMLDAIGAARANAGEQAGLVICFRDESGARTERLLPLASVPKLPSHELPYTHQPAQRVVNEVARHYLFHQMLAILLRSLRVENRMRLLQMEDALQHIERNSDELLRRSNQLRQEEIVEEIELICGEKSRR